MSQRNVLGIGAIWSAVVAAGLGLSACPGSSTYGTTGGNTSRRSTTAGTSGSSASAGTATGVSSTSSGSASTTGATGGTTTGGAMIGTGFFEGVPLTSNGCPDPSAVLPMRECDAGVELVWLLVDYCSMAPLATNTDVGVSDYLDPTIQGTLENCGYVYACVQPNTPVALLVEGDGYYPELSPLFQISENTELPSVGMVLFCDELTAGVSGLPGFDPSQAIIAAFVQPLDQAQDAGCSNTAGWSFTFEDSSGRVLDAGAVFPAGQGLAPGDVTDTYGVEIAYDIDPAAAYVTIIGSNAANDLPDGGTLCPELGTGSPYYLTGKLPIRAGTATFAPYVIP